MKKILALIGCLLLSSVFLFGCSFNFLGSCGGETVAPILSEKPWNNVNGYEQTTYNLTRRAGFDYSLNDGAGITLDDGKIEAKGTFTATVETVSDNFYNSSAFTALKAVAAYDGYFDKTFGNPDDKKLSSVANTYTLYSTVYELAFKADSAHAGKTDTMTSYVLLKTSSLLPVFSVKEVKMESAPNNSYSTMTDYVNRISRLTYTDYYNGATEAQTVETTLKKKLEAYDYESLYLVFRAHSSLTASGSSSVAVHNAVYAGLNKQQTRTIAFQSGLSIMGGYDEDNAFLGNYTDATYYASDVEKKDSDGKTVMGENGKAVIEHYRGYELPVYAVINQVSATDHGPTKSLVYSATGFKGIRATTEKVLLGFTETDADTEGKVTHVTVGTIAGYTTDRA